MFPSGNMAWDDGLPYPAVQNAEWQKTLKQWNSGRVLANTGGKSTIHTLRVAESEKT